MGLSVWLFSGFRLRHAGMASAALHAVFIAWAVAALVRGLDIPNCGCFGVFWARPLNFATVAEGPVLLLLSLAVRELSRD